MFVTGSMVVKVGGPVYRIGVGGGAASSIQVRTRTLSVTDPLLFIIYINNLDCSIASYMGKFSDLLMTNDKCSIPNSVLSFQLHKGYRYACKL